LRLPPTANATWGARALLKMIDRAPQVAFAVLGAEKGEG